MNDTEIKRLIEVKEQAHKKRGYSFVKHNSFFEGAKDCVSSFIRDPHITYQYAKSLKDASEFKNFACDGITFARYRGILIAKHKSYETLLGDPQVRLFVDRSLAKNEQLDLAFFEVCKGFISFGWLDNRSDIQFREGHSIGISSFTFEVSGLEEVKLCN